MTASKHDIGPFVKLTGTVGAAEVLSHLYETCQTGEYKPVSTTALQHLVQLGYLKPDYGRGVVKVQLERIAADLAAVKGA